MLKTRVLQVDPLEPAPEPLAEAAAILRRGGLVAFATETVYGLGAIATDAQAVARIYAAKGRPSFNPLIVHVDGIDQAKRYAAGWPELANRLAERFWPGPLSIVLPKIGAIPSIVSAGRETIALRVPAPAVARGLIAQTMLPLAAPSANRSNEISPTTAAHVLAGLDGRIDLVLDSGPTSVGLESTVVRLEAKSLQILRPGPIGLAELRECVEGIPDVEVSWPESATSVDQAVPASPGQLSIHYAPKTKAVRIETPQDLAVLTWPDRAGLLILGETARDVPPVIGPRIVLPTVPIATRQLYAALHDLDAANLDLIVVLMPPDTDDWRAVRDRVIRATRPTSSITE